MIGEAWDKTEPTIIFKHPKLKIAERAIKCIQGCAFIEHAGSSSLPLVTAPERHGGEADEGKPSSSPGFCGMPLLIGPPDANPDIRLSTATACLSFQMNGLTHGLLPLHPFVADLKRSQDSRSNLERTDSGSDTSWNSMDPPDDNIDQSISAEHIHRTHVFRDARDPL